MSVAASIDRARRAFLRGLAAAAVGAAGARAETAARSRRVAYASPDGHGEIAAVLAEPSDADEATPSVLVIHEDHGLTPYVVGVAEGLAQAGFRAMAPDGLSALGGFPGAAAEGRALQRELDPERLLEDFFAGFEHLAGRAPGGKLGALGFGYGGGVAAALAVVFPDLAAAATFYGRAPRPREAAALTTPLQRHAATFDAGANDGWAAFEAALAAHGGSVETHHYAGAARGFHNPDAPSYDAIAAALSWSRTRAFLDRHLR